MNQCERLKKTLVASGRSGIEQNADLAAHLRDCATCQQLLRAWNQIPGLLQQLPEHDPDNALLQKVNRKLATAGRNSAPGRRRFLAPSLASAAVLLAAIGLSRELLLHEAPKAPVTINAQGTLGQSVGGPDGQIPAARIHDAAGQAEEHNATDNPRSVESDHLEEPRRRNAPVQESATPTVDGKLNNERRAETTSSAEPRSETPLEGFRDKQSGDKTDLEDADGGSKKGTDRNRRQLAGREDAPPALEAELARKAAVIDKTELVPQEMGQIEVYPDEAPAQTITGGAGGYALDFLDYYQQTRNLQFQPATGYWANTYIPGDPEIRWLSARLAQWDRSWLQGDAGLEQHVAPVKQPFDAPDDNALALNLMADANAVLPAGATHQATRMRVQVGIRAIEHRQGQRPAMSFGVVIDLPADAPDTVRIASRALLDALLQSKQTGDRFSLVLTGQAGKSRSLVVAPGDFRFGPLQLAKQIILGQDTAAARADKAGPESSSLDLYAALQRAESMVQQNDDPSRPLGSSSVLLISARQIDQLDRLIALAHASAQKGITLSVFPLGEQAQSSQVDQLVLAGLGNRRFLEAPGQARQLIEAELYASSRAVARAARLSIRLAPGVQLIGVVGSERLDTERAQRVREIENSMDRRLLANLGIQADRGDDDEGIQILIPGIYSGDSIVVLLDVVTGRPGAIADVSLRYKDLVYLRNGSLQGHLELPEGELKRGPAELAVLKNLLSHHFVLAVKQAAAVLGRRQANDAADILRAMHASIGQVRQEVPEWARDPDLIRDQQVLERYITALVSPQAGAHQSFLENSLRYAAWAKTHRGLKEWK